MTDTKLPQEKQPLRSPDFKYIPCDAVNLAISDNGVKLLLGVDELDGTTLELVGVHLTHSTAMFLKAALAEGLDHYQSETGTKFPEPELNRKKKPTENP